MHDKSEKNDFIRDDDLFETVFDSSFEKNHVEHLDKTYEAEDIDIQVVNELATVQDDTSLPCYTVRVFVTGIVSMNMYLSFLIKQLITFTYIHIYIRH